MADVFHVEPKRELAIPFYGHTTQRKGGAEARRGATRAMGKDRGGGRNGLDRRRGCLFPRTIGIDDGPSSKFDLQENPSSIVLEVHHWKETRHGSFMHRNGTLPFDEEKERGGIDGLIQMKIDEKSSIERMGGRTNPIAYVPIRRHDGQASGIRKKKHARVQG